MDIHNDDFASFIVHQLPIGQLEQLWSLYSLCRAGELAMAEIEVQAAKVQHGAPPITDQEIADFKRNLKTQLRGKW